MLKSDGVFSTSLRILELQIKNLMEGAGGSRALTFLDKLSNLAPLEQHAALDAFTRTVDRIAAGDKRFTTAEEQEFQKIEDGLYNEILGAMADASGAESVMFPQSKSAAKDGKLSVLDGGRLDGGKLRDSVRMKSEISGPSNTPIDFKAALKSKRQKDNQCLN